MTGGRRVPAQVPVRYRQAWRQAADIADALAADPGRPHVRQVVPSNREYVVEVVRRRARQGGLVVSVLNRAPREGRALDRQLDRAQPIQFTVSAAPGRRRRRVFDLVDTGEL